MSKEPNYPSHFIGIGASAGGLEALQILLQNLPVDMGACYIVVQHLSPDFESMMSELLTKHTIMDIHNVVDGVTVEANNIYLIPPKKNMIIAEGKLLLSDKMPDTGLNLPIDIFFRSLSEDQQHRAIGIILSGTGSDGSRGIKALKEAGALIIAQQPDNAKFDGMPNSAIMTGLVDLILTTEEIGKKLEDHIQHPLVSGKPENIRDELTGSEETMAEIFNLLKIKSEIDFAKYKPSTVARRIERRMTVNQITKLREYLTLLFKDPEEIRILNRELLIGVTRFFRDEEAFSILKDDVIPQIVRDSIEEEDIRVWITACSTGEEAYSLAILFTEEIVNQKINRKVKIFATDVNSDSIADASNGIYSDEILHDVSPEIAQKYFKILEDGKLKISKSLREKVVFATHNIITDPPFSNMNLVTCRNVLIYFQHSIQKGVLAALHFALRQNGYLFLGSSESLGDISPHFEVINERNRIYKKQSNVRIPIGSKPPVAREQVKNPQDISSISTLLKNYTGYNFGSAINYANERLIKHYAPPCILASEDFEALHVYGDVSNYIRRLPPGRISKDIKDLVNEDLSIGISSALFRAKQNPDEIVHYTDVPTVVDDVIFNLDILVFYLKENSNENSQGYYWIIFEDKGKKNIEVADANKISFDSVAQSTQHIYELEAELKRNKESLQVTVEELETTNEELQSANEELMSANEELQSTNEELQSVNEELYTVNSEYQEKILEISESNSDLDEVLKLSNIGIIFLDEDLLIRRFTPVAARFINLQSTDLKRPIHHISSSLEYDEMLNDISSVISNNKAIEKEIRSNGGLVNISINPYQYSDANNYPGVAITFSDISEVRLMEKAMNTVYSELRSSIHNTIDILDTKPFDEIITALIVDDDNTELEIISEELSRSNRHTWRIIKANNVDDAYQHFAKKNIDVCFCDYNLSPDTAIDLFNKMKEGGIKTPLVVVTGDKIDSLDATLLGQGVLDLVYKDELDAAVLTRSAHYAIRRRQINESIDNLPITVR
ncbi:MAG: chemotaxis protein CheB [Gammaproteobacteria bacterium]